MEEVLCSVSSLIFSHNHISISIIILSYVLCYIILNSSMLLQTGVMLVSISFIVQLFVLCHRVDLDDTLCISLIFACLHLCCLYFISVSVRNHFVLHACLCLCQSRQRKPVSTEKLIAVGIYLYILPIKKHP